MKKKVGFINSIFRPLIQELTTPGSGTPTTNSSLNARGISWDVSSGVSIHQIKFRTRTNESTIRLEIYDRISQALLYQRFNIHTIANEWVTINIPQLDFVATDSFIVMFGTNPRTTWDTNEFYPIPVSPLVMVGGYISSLGGFPTTFSGSNYDIEIIPIRNEIAVHDDTLTAVPTGLAGTPGNTQVELTWNVNIESNFSYYKLYRNGSLIYSGSDLTYLDTGLTNGVSYAYTIQSVNTSGLASALSSAVNVTPNTPSLFAGNPPTSNSLTTYPKITKPGGATPIAVTNQAELVAALNNAAEHVEITAASTIAITSEIFLSNQAGTIKKRYFNNVTLDCTGLNGHPFRFSDAGGWVFASSSGEPTEGLTIDGASNSSSPNDGAIQVFNFTSTKQQLTFAAITFKNCNMTGIQVFANAGTPVLIQDCVGYLFNPTKAISGTNAPDFILCSGFDSDADITSNCTVVRCIANMTNCDDGIDFFRGKDNQAIDCVIIDAGIGHTGDGNGFKLGNGNDTPNNSGNNDCTGCIAVNPKATGFTFNSSPNNSDVTYCTVVGGVAISDYDGGNKLVVTKSISDTNDFTSLATGSSQNSVDAGATGTFSNAATGDLSPVVASGYETMVAGAPGGATDVAIQLYMDLFSLVG